jgi:hypothetical protein
MAAENGSGDGTVLNTSQADLASMLAVHRQAINLHLREFEKDGLIRLKRQKIEILDLETLSELASTGQNDNHDAWGPNKPAALEHQAFTFDQFQEEKTTLPVRRSVGLMAVDAAEYSTALMTDAAGTLKQIQAGLEAVDRAIEQQDGKTIWNSRG